MKKLLTLLFLTGSLFCNAQNYQCLQSGVQHYFINGNGYLRGIRIDSVKTSGSDVIYYPFHTPRGTYDPSGMSRPVLDTGGGSWLGKKVIQHADGTFVFDSYWNDSVILKTQANVGDSWVFYSDASSLYYKATVMSTDTMTVLSAPDSVKTIIINAYNGSGIVTSDPLNGFNIILSKNNAFVQIFDLYTFPYHKPDSAYRAGLDFFLDRSTLSYSNLEMPGGLSPAPNISLFSLTDFINPNDQQLHNWGIGDIFEGRHTFANFPIIYPTTGDVSYIHYILDTVVSEVISGHSINYTLNGTHSSCSYYADPCDLIINGGTYTFYDSTYPLAKLNYIPEENMLLSNYLYYFPNDSSECVLSPAYILTSYSTSESGYGPGTYKLGIGKTGYQLSDVEDWIWVTDQLVYTNINGVSCGTIYPTGVNTVTQQSNQIQIYPNPATDELTIQTNNTLPRTITLINMMGQTVTTIHTLKPQETINVTKMPAGVYNVSITDEGGNRYNEKVVVVH